MTGYELTFEDFSFLVGVVSRHHRKWIAETLSLTAHTRRGVAYFRGPGGDEVALEEAYRRSQADAQVQHRVYNLYMHYR